MAASTHLQREFFRSATPMSAPYYDPYDYAIDADPHPSWKQLRDEAPLYRNEKLDFYALSRFRDVMTASLDSELYSSAYGTVLEMMSDEPNGSPMMIWLDPPQHDRLRKLVSRAFSPRRIGELEPRIRDLCRNYLEPFRGEEGFDYVQDFGAKLPVMVISSLLGIPEEDHEQIRIWTDALLHRDPGQLEGSRKHEEVSQQLWGYFASYVAERRKRPADDMISILIDSRVEMPDGSSEKLDDTALLSFIGLLSAAGNETVARFLGWSATALARFPGERRKLVADPGLIPGAVEEILRFEAPSPVQARRVMRETKVHGEILPEGARVLLLTGSAGRDEREYPDPDRLDISRNIDRHVSLGYGLHFCLGASLARLEARIALEETLRRFPEWTVDWEETEMVHTSTVRGYAKVPIRF